MLWRHIFTADQQQYVIATAASGRKTGKDSSDMKDAGIIDAHAYSLLEAAPIVTEDKQKVRLLKLRNPWGFEEWNGDWSDKDNKNWTSSLRKRLNFEAKDDGVFFIDFENYLGYYYNTTICKYKNGKEFKYYSAKETAKKYAVFKFEIKPSKLKTKVYLAVNQLNSRFKSKNEQFHYAPVKVMVAKLVNGQLKFVDGDAVEF